MNRRTALLSLLLGLSATTAKASITQQQVAAARDYQTGQYHAAANMVAQLTDIAKQYHILSYEFQSICQSCESYYRQMEKHGKARDALIIVLSVNTSDYTQRVNDQKALQENLADIYDGQLTTQWIYDQQNYPKALMYDKAEKHSYAASVLGSL